jgi:hypothetical protein
MSQENPVRLFVTHCFSKNDDYLRVFEFLESATNFYYVNCSSPESIPAAGGTEAMKDELRRQMNLAEAVIVLDSTFAENQDLAMFQLNAAKALEKPIIAMERFGVVLDLPEEITQRADAKAPWNERLMVDIILREARHENTMRWEVVEFEL